VALDRALAAIAREARPLHRRLVARLDGRALGLEVGGRGHLIWIGAHEGDAPAPAARIITTRAALIALADGASLEAALADGRLEVRGPVDETLRVFDALNLFVHAAARSPSAAPILQAWRWGEAP